MTRCAYIAEAIGTFTLVFIGAGCASLGFGGLNGVALAHGFVIIAMATIFGSISGGHFNPSVTLAMALGKKINTQKAVGYVCAQLIGSTLAAFMLKFLLSGIDTNLGMTTVTPQLSSLQAIILEAILTFFLVFAVLRSSKITTSYPLTPFIAGLTLAFSILMAGPLTGGSLNFARSFGPAIAMGSLNDLWIYAVGPYLGAVLAWWMDHMSSCTQGSCSIEKH